VTTPLVVSVHPHTGDAAGGETVEISGRFLDEVDRVTFGRQGPQATIESVTPLTDLLQQMTVTSPPAAHLGRTHIYLWSGDDHAMAGAFTYTGELVEPDEPIAPPPPPPQRWPNLPGFIPDIVGRRGWLTLGTLTVPLCDEGAGGNREMGYVCTELNIGYPTVREVSDSHAGRHGAEDRTSLFGARAVTATISCPMPGGNMTRDQVSRLFGPFTNPGARPTLRYRLDDPSRPADERMLTLRASDFTSALNADTPRSIALGWVAPDPIIYSTLERTATATPAGLRTGGLKFPTLLPFAFSWSAGAGGGTVPLPMDGDADVYPTITVFGEVTAPVVRIRNFAPDGTITAGRVGLRNGFVVEPGEAVVFDTAAKTVTRFPDGARLEGAVSTWGESWPVIKAGMLNTFDMEGGSQNDTARAVVAWHDGWLSP